MYICMWLNTTLRAVKRLNKIVHDRENAARREKLHYRYQTLARICCRGIFCTLPIPGPYPSRTRAVSGPFQHYPYRSGEEGARVMGGGGKDTRQKRERRRDERGKRKEERGKSKGERGKRKEQRGKRKEERAKRKEAESYQEYLS